MSEMLAGVPILGALTGADARQQARHQGEAATDATQQQLAMTDEQIKHDRAFEDTLMGLVQDYRDSGVFDSSRVLRLAQDDVMRQRHRAASDVSSEARIAGAAPDSTPVLNHWASVDQASENDLRNLRINLPLQLGQAELGAMKATRTGQPEALLGARGAAVGNYAGVMQQNAANTLATAPSLSTLAQIYMMSQGGGAAKPTGGGAPATAGSLGNLGSGSPSFMGNTYGLDYSTPLAGNAPDFGLGYNWDGGKRRRSLSDYTPSLNYAA